jgi:autotransporter-associated beta strand protein
MSYWRRRTMIPILALATLLAGSSTARAIQLVLDYQFDVNNFFSTQQRKDTLQAAANFFNGSFNDQLTAIQPGGSNTWHGDFFDPATGIYRSVTNLTISTNQIIVYAGGRNLGGALGIGGPGGYGASSTSNVFLDTVAARGQAGALNPTPTDFGPWGGSVTFDTTATWHFDPSTLPASGEADFYSVALHELGHLLGFGSADSWYPLINSTNFNFIGTNSVAAYGGPVPLSDNGHWLQGITSTVLGTSTTQEVAMAPAITIGTRKLFTTLDMAGLRDVGWNFVPQTFTWKGAVNQTWDFTGSNTNWNSPGIAYIDGRNVVLDDTVANTNHTAINLTATVMPLSLLVSNNAVAYSIGGAGAINGTTSLIKNGTNTLTLATSNNYSGGTTINAGKLFISHSNALGSGAVATANPGAGTELHFASTAIIHGLTVGTNTLVSIDTNGQNIVITDSLSITGSSSNSPAGTINLHNNALAIHNGDLPTITAAIAAGKHGGDWLGKGITSSFVAAHANLLTIAADYAQNTGNGTSFAWFGQTVSTGDVLVMPTLIGDLNMDGSVNSLDYFALTPNLGKTGQTWGTGDISGDGAVNSLDYFALTPNLGKTLVGLSPAFTSSSSEITTTPEPASLVLLGLGGVMLLGRRGRSVRSQPLHH